MRHERRTTDISALASLGRSAAVLLPRDGGEAVVVHDADAPQGALLALTALTHDAALARLPEGAMDVRGICPDARPLLAGVPAPLCALALAEAGAVVLMAWGEGARQAGLDAAFRALEELRRLRGRSSPTPFGDIFENAVLCMAVIGADRTLHAANRATRRILREGAALTAVGGRLRAPDPSSDRRLGEAIEAAARRDAPRALRLTAPPAGAALRCEIARVDRPSARVDAPARYLLTLAVEEAGVPMEALLAGRFGLTPSEARLAAALVAGDDLRAAGERLGVSRHTARKYLQIVFSKMGVRRQADLVRRAMSLSRDRAADETA